jgi:hypothetical protein
MTTVLVLLADELIAPGVAAVETSAALRRSCRRDDTSASSRTQDLLPWSPA